MMDDAALEREIDSYDSTAPVRTSGGNRVARSKLLSLLDNCRAEKYKCDGFKSDHLAEGNASSAPISLAYSGLIVGSLREQLGLSLFQSICHRFG